MTLGGIAVAALAACDYDEAAKEPGSGPIAGADAGGAAGALGQGGSELGASGSAGAGEPAAGAAGASGSGSGEALSFGGLTVTTTPAQHGIDVFGLAGHRFWVEVNDEQLERMNSGSGGVIWEGEFGDIYTPGNPRTFADHVLVKDFKSGRVADYGKLEVKLVGESTGRPWTFSSIPNVRVDTDEFQDGLTIGGVEHLRLNNGQVGSIFREHVAHRIYQALGYPSLRSTFAFLGSNVWGDGVWVPMTLIEVYKCATFEGREELLGGACVTMWEFAGDLGGEGPMFGGDTCQEKSCDSERLDELGALIDEVPQGDGFAEALSEYVDWDYFHRFQCLSWILWTGDDPIHNTNNNLIIERDDGRMVWAPYSVDISAGQDWYQNVPLTGSSQLATGCQADPSCWEATIATCEDLIADFKELAPETLVDETKELLRQRAMLRQGDMERAESLREWYVQRQADLEAELERYRYLPDPAGNCPNELELCNDGTCGTPEQCEERLCSAGQEWCEAFGYCVDPMWEECPSCSDDAPHWCREAGQCVADEAACEAYCVEAYGNPHCCSMGQEWCEAFGYCVDPMWEQCPSCTPEAPYWCPAIWECVVDEAACRGVCQEIGQIYCEAVGACMFPEECGGPIDPLPIPR